MLASVNGVFNAAMVKADLADTTLYYGRGAGRLPTASTVIGDIADVAFNRVHRAPLKVIIPKAVTPVRMKDPGEVVSRHYIRLCVKDEVGAMAKIMGLLASHGVSIAFVVQKDALTASAAGVPVIILTHAVKQKEIDGALQAIAALPIVDGVPVRLGIE